MSLAPAIRQIARPGDMVMCFGAGNSTDWAHALPDWLAASGRGVQSRGAA